MTSYAGGAPDLDDLPAAMAELAGEFHAVGERERLQLLLELSQGLPALPERYGENCLATMERVDECQSPVFLAVEVGTDPDRTVHLFFQAPAEAPTTKGFAGILHESLDGLPAAAVIGVPEDAPYRFGLAQAVSPLRMRGMVGMLARIKRQVQARTAAADAGPAEPHHHEPHDHDPTEQQ